MISRRRKNSPLDALIEATREQPTIAQARDAADLTADELDQLAGRLMTQAESMADLACMYRIRANEARSAERARLERIWEQS